MLILQDNTGGNSTVHNRKKRRDSIDLPALFSIKIILSYFKNPSCTKSSTTSVGILNSTLPI